MALQNRTALVTGASSGIGAAVAEVLAAEGFALVLTARREDRLRKLATRLRDGHSVEVVVMPCDLMQAGAVRRLCAQLRERRIHIDVLVNSAGFGAAGGYAANPWTLHRSMLDLMVLATSELTHQLLEGMVNRRYGRIINVASVAGLVHAGAGTTYEAAKAFVVGFSRSLAAEVRSYGVHVTAVCPGLTRTEFHDAPSLRATVRAMPRWMWMDPRAVAEGSIRAVMAGKPVFVPGLLNGLLVAGLTYAPRVCGGVARVGVRLVRRAGATLEAAVTPARRDA